jgi:preprotein translocase subunit SecA
MGTLGVPDEMPIENKMVSRSIESAQKKVEGRNFDLRKHVVEYDDVMNKHRDTMYRKRNEILEMDATGLKAYALELIEQEISQVVSFHTNDREEDEEAEDWDMGKLCDTMNTIFPFPMAECLTTIQDTRQSVGKFEQAKARTKLIEVFTQRAEEEFDKVIEHLGTPETVTAVLHSFILRAMDLLWIEHLDQMAYLRDAIGLRGYGQRDPLVEYKRESYQLFQELLSHIQRQVVYNIFKLQTAKIVTETESVEEGESQPLPPSIGLVTAADTPQLSPNDPCWCGSGKKFKKCHGGGKR